MRTARSAGGVPADEGVGHYARFLAAVGAGWQYDFMTLQPLGRACLVVTGPAAAGGSSATAGRPQVRAA
jgi:hypothetical protein